VAQDMSVASSMELFHDFFVMAIIGGF